MEEVTRVHPDDGSTLKKTEGSSIGAMQHISTPPRFMSLTFQNLSVHAFGHQTDYQRTVSNYPGTWISMVMNWVIRKPRLRIDILHKIDGIVSSGEMLLVLGNPGSGCTTLLKSLAGQTYDLCVDKESILNYRGLSSRQMFTEFRGKCTYQAEFDIHFPSLTMRETLEIAFKARKPPTCWDICHNAVANEARILGLMGALDTNMGNAFLPGVSGGERKRTSIAEILLGDTFFQCWDNSTRGLDSANALDFIKSLRRRTSESGSVAIVTLYQASEEIYNLFDKVTVLYEGRQIYFGPARNAKKYFTDIGFPAPSRSTTAEYLTSVTRPLKLRPRTRGNIREPPETAADFAKTWKDSLEYRMLASEIETYNRIYALGDDEALRLMRKEAKGVEEKLSPYILAVQKQVTLCVHRGFLRLRHNLAVPVSTIIGNFITSIILGSMFYNMPEDTSSFFGRGVLLFFTSLVNTTLAAFESVALWDDRPIIEKHVQYGFYHAFAEAIASFVCDLPNKVVLTFVFNFPLYFLSNLRRTPGAFFTYYLFSLLSLLNGSVIYRSMGAMSRTLVGSQPPGAVLVVLLTIYSGFVVPFQDMRPWLKWFSYINPVYYAFEAMIINEFSGREFDCASFIPKEHRYASQFICSSTGAKPGEASVSGDAYIRQEFGFEHSHVWRNLGICLALWSLFSCVYLFGTEFITMLPPRSDVLLFQRGHMPSTNVADEEKGTVSLTSPEKQKVHDEKTNYDALNTGDGAHLLWSGLTYKIKIGKKYKLILNNIDGWVKPGTLTALMGPSGAGKTTLLNILAGRTTVGVVTGDRVVATRFQNISFARKIGYAQQDDIHLPTASVREALTFSALLRQPMHYSKAEKLAYVDHVIELLDMEAFQHAVVGRLNIEQKKRVTIGTELAARPELLLFLDEPTSGLDSDSSWYFCTLLRRLTAGGQAILCTIHQPSSPLLSLFDRLLFLKDGESIYFGEFGPEFRTLVRYFESHGARECSPHENPGEWMMEVTSNNSHNQLNWADTWNKSAECAAIRAECDQMKEQLSKISTIEVSNQNIATEFATSFWYQLVVVTRRAFQHDWRSPEYLYSKSLTTFGCAFINGLSFWSSGNTSQDVQNQIFSLFLLTTIFGTHVQLIMERFYHSRVIYENRERQSRTYSWLVFLISNILVELASQTVISVIAYVSWYYPLGLWKKALDQHELNNRSGLIFLLLWSLFILFQTLSQMLMTVLPNIPTGINIGNLFFMLSLIFSGVLVPPNALPRFWIFMYRATPLSYYISAIISTGLSGIDIACSPKDVLKLDPPPGETCISYLNSSAYVILNPDNTANCEVCMYTTADSLLAYFDIYFKDRWWEWGVTIAYNIGMVRHQEWFSGTAANSCVLDVTG
ncbi:BcatrD protein [Hypoxylon sp. FL0890]|nr:BcatrD protein [Hypoxylon sp. FL0890]